MPHSNERSPSVPEPARRTFLKVGAGTLAALAFSGALRLDALAQEQEGFQFFTNTEGATLEAIAERIWPESEDSAGAREAGVAHYIDRALAGPYAEYAAAYRVALDRLDRDAGERYGGAFRDLDDDQQDALLAELEELGESPDDPLEGLPGREMELGLGYDSAFDMIRTHVMEGLFADPIYGGNRDFAGWRAVNYPGAHYVYTAEEQQTFEPLDKPFQSVADL